MTKSTGTSLTAVALTLLSYKKDAEDGRRDRMDLNNDNFNTYHSKQDYSHKKAGQSKEFLPKQSVAVDQLTSSIQLGLVNADKWYEIEDKVKNRKRLITGEEMEKILDRQLEKDDYDAHVADDVKSGLLGALMITKSHGKTVQDKEFLVVDNDEEEDQEELQMKTTDIWQLKHSLVRQEDYFPDPTGAGLYEMERIYIDKHSLVKLAEENSDIFDVEMVKNLEIQEEVDQTQKKAEETGQNVVYSQRKRLEVYEFYGTILDPTTGMIIEEDGLKYENVTCMMSRDGQIFMKPRKNPFWHQESPYTATPIIRVPNGVWGKAIMDDATQLNLAANEVFNLMLDAGIMSVFGIKQLREQWMADPDQVSDGIAPGDTIPVNSSCPPGGKVLERVDTGSLNSEAMNVFNILDKEINSAAKTNSIRLGGLPERQTKATEIIASGQSINTTFDSIVKILETQHIRKVLKKDWMLVAQHINDLGTKEMEVLLGEERAQIIKRMSNKRIFADTVSGRQFNVFGLSTTLNKVQDFQKIASFLQTLAGNPFLMQIFLQKFSGNKLLAEIISSLDIDAKKIEMSEDEVAGNQAMQEQLKAAAGGGTPDNESQNPQIANRPPESGTGNDIDKAELANQSRI